MVSYYDSPLLDNSISSVTSLRFDAAELGRIACQKLIDRLSGKADGDYILPGYQIVIRDSTK